MPIFTEGYLLRKAVQWISDLKNEQPDESIHTLIEKACVQFNISPKDSDFLLRLYNENTQKKV